MSDARETLRRGIGGFAPRPDAYERVLERRDRKRRNQRIMAGALAIVIMIIGALAFVGATRSAPPPPLNGGIADSGGWIAYSTTSSHQQRPRPGEDFTGSDIFLVREGDEPRLVASRGDGTTWNICPAFSPDGTMLAFGSRSPSGRTVRVVGVTLAGTIAAPSIVLDVPGDGLAPCPRWASDGSRLAYLSGGTVVVRGLDGSSPVAVPGDPVRADFRGHPAPLVSPSGDLVARLAPSSCEVIVTRVDGSEERRIGTSCVYQVAAWSSDSRRILVMRDIDGRHFRMVAWSVDAPFGSVVIVDQVRVNHARSWPGLGDVSWQPRTS
jgi:hypothetical protein